MTFFVAILCGLALALVLGCGVGLGAGAVFTSLYGYSSGDNQMEGFFVFGPFGFVGGFLLGAAAYLRHSAGPKPFSTGLLWGAGIVLGLGFVIFLVPVLKAADERSRRAAFNIELEFEIPAESELHYEDRKTYRWGYAGESKDESASTPFYTQQCRNGVCVLPVALQMNDNPARRLVIFTHKSQRETFSIPLVGMIKTATEWSAWEQRKDLRFRWMMKKMK